MLTTLRSGLVAVAAFAAMTTLTAQQSRPGSTPGPQDSARFRSGVDLINVTATVTSEGGRFITGLTRDDFVVYEDDKPQDVTYFSADRVPVSLGIVLDTSGSMAGDKFDDARIALDRFTLDLLDQDDEVFLYRFSDHPILVQGWTTDRAVLSREMSRIAPNGGTALYDAVSEAVPLAAQGTHPKKALVIISDGNDTSSVAYPGDVRDRIRNSDVLVYAIGIDGVSAETFRQRPPNQPRLPAPTPFPPGRRPGGRFPVFPQIVGPGAGRRPPARSTGDDRVNERALRDLTDSSGGRTAIIRSSRDLKGATADIADELSQQYTLGYSSSMKDGRWHSLRVDVRNSRYRVRARQGFVAN